MENLEDSSSLIGMDIFPNKKKNSSVLQIFSAHCQKEFFLQKRICSSWGKFLRLIVDNNRFREGIEILDKPLSGTNIVSHNSNNTITGGSIPLKTN